MDEGKKDLAQSFVDCRELMTFDDQATTEKQVFQKFSLCRDGEKAKRFEILTLWKRAGENFLAQSALTTTALCIGPKFFRVIFRF